MDNGFPSARLPAMSPSSFTRITFNAGGNAAASMVSGWAMAEPIGTWTLGTHSLLEVSDLQPGTGYRGVVEVGPYLDLPVLTFQQLTISAGGFICVSQQLAETARLVFDIPAEAIGSDGRLRLELACPMATAPATIGASSDIRKLGVCVWSLELIARVADVAADPQDGPTARALAPLRERGLHLRVGRHSYGTPEVSFNDRDPKAVLEIGGFCSIATGCHIFVGSFGRHPLDFLTTFPLGLAFRAPRQRDVSEVERLDLGVRIGADDRADAAGRPRAGLRLRADHAIDAEVYRSGQYIRLRRSTAFARLVCGYEVARQFRTDRGKPDGIAVRR